MLQDLLWQTLSRTVDSTIRAFDGVMGVAILDLSDGRLLERNADAVFPSASIIKLAVMAELYRQADQPGPGQATLTDLYTPDPADIVDDSVILAGLTAGITQVTNRDLATFMIAVSDNGATNVLIDRVGMERVNTLLASLGFHATRLRRKMIDLAAARAGRENTATPHELVQLLEALYQGRVLSPALTEDFFTILSTRKESSIPRLLPTDTRVANKPGALESVRGEAGIVFAPQRPFAICVMTTYVANERGAEEAIASLASAAYTTFDRLGCGSEYGRRID